jgi:hypothetical protein
MPDHLKHESKSERKEEKKDERWLRLALVMLAGVLAVLLLFLFVQYQSLREQQIISSRELRWSLFLKNHAPLSPDSTSVIRTWMTFDYVNRLFGLPPDYLKAAMDITDPRYPRVTLSNYAKEMKVSVTSTLEMVQSTVSKYALPKNEPPDETPTSSPQKPASA